MKGYAVRDEMNGITEPAGKTWFWELAAAVVDTDRCVQCGTCVAVCPSNSLGVNLLTNLPELVKMCTGCSLCWDFCPRAGLRYEATWPRPEGAPADPPGTESDDDWKLTGSPASAGLGVVEEMWAVRTTLEVGGLQDGGAVTAILEALLESNAIDGAIVSKPSSDPAEPWKGIATVATTTEELRGAAGSFYNQTMALAALDVTGVDLPDRPRLAVVGTPCEVQGLSAMQQARWDTGAHDAGAAILSIALMCTKSFDYEGLMLRELRDKRGIELGDVRRLDVTRGRLVVELHDGTVAVDEPIKHFHGAALKGCDECADFLGRSADLSVGSVGSADGWTSVLVRTPAGRAALDAARHLLDIEPLDDVGALLRLDSLNKKVASKALKRQFDPDGPLFIDFTQHLATYGPTDRAPVVLRR
jgi:coenzyme F420 hydrogenase subunit beta